MIIGLVEVHLHDEHGNLLNVARGHNIMFDNVRVNMLLNPCIIDGNASSYVMYFSEYWERAVGIGVASYYYWDSSPLTHYTTASITMGTPEVLDRHSLQPQDVLTQLYQFTSASVLPGATARTLRVVGLRTGSTYCTAITLNTPIDHGVSTYVTGYYKLILGVGEESYLYGNVYNWISRTWYTPGSHFYKKGFIFLGDVSNFNRNTTETITSLTARTQSAYNSLPINTGLTTASIFGSKMKDNNPSVALFAKDTETLPAVSKSRTFLHPAGSTYFYGYIYETEPLTEGSIRIDDISDYIYSWAECINITKSGAIGESEYYVTLYPLPLTDNTKFLERLLTLFYASYPGGMRSYYQWNAYFSENRVWGAYYRPLYLEDSSLSYYSSVTRPTTISIWYKGLYRTYDLGTDQLVQDMGIISNSGELFYVKTSSLNILRKYDFEQLYVDGYAEESSSLSTSTEILSCQMDEADGKVVAQALNLGSELVVNGTFDTDTNGWTAEPLVTLSVVSQQLNMAMGGTHVGPNGCYQDVATVVGQRYRFSIDYISGSSSYWQYWRIDLGSTTSFITMIDPTNDKTTVPFSRYSAYFTATSTTTRIRICATYSGTAYNLRFDNISLREVAGKIVKFDTNDISTYTEYDISHPNFSALATDSLLFTVTSGFTPYTSRWYWRVSNKKMVWVGSASKKRLHYWDGDNAVETFTIPTTGTVVDVCVTDDFKKVCYAVQNGTSVSWLVLSLEDGTRWAQLFTITRTVIAGGSSTIPLICAGCFVEGNWMYQLSGSNSWGYRTNLITYTSESWPTYVGYTGASWNCRTISLPNRSPVQGSLVYNMWSYYSTNSICYNWFLLDVSPLNFGWDGTNWIHNHASNKITHRAAEDLPFYGSIGFGVETEPDPGPPTENYISGEYFSFSVNPSGYIFDNTMTYTGTSWVYTGAMQEETETFTLLYNDPLVPANITITLGKANHPDWLCLESSPEFITATIDGSPCYLLPSSTSYLSYYGEFRIQSATAGTLTFHQSCYLHSVTVKYYWIRRDV